MSFATAPGISGTPTAEAPPDWQLSVISYGRQVVEALGIPVRLEEMDPDTAFGVVALPAVMILLVLVTQLPTMARAVASRDFWRDGGRLLTVLHLCLLLLAYAFSSGDQPRPLREAVAEIADGQLSDFLPLAVLTQWALLSVLWVAFGLLTGVSRSALNAPFAAVWAMGMVAALIIGFTAAWMIPSTGGGVVGHAPAAVAVVGVLLVYGYLSAINRNRMFTPAGMERRRELLEQARLRGEEEVALAMMRTAANIAPVSGIGGTWWPTPRQVLQLTSLWALLLGIPAAIITAVYSTGRFTPPTFDGVMHVELLVLSVLLLLMLFSFRKSLDTMAYVSPALPRLLDLSLVLSAGVLSVSGLANAPVTLGAVPPWALAVGPPLLVAALVFQFGVLPHRRETRRWPLALLGAVAAAPLIIPLKAALVPLLDSVIHTLAL